MLEQPAGADSDAAWEQWFDVQSNVCHEVDAVLAKAGDGRSDQFTAALIAGLVEHLGERQRSHLTLPGSDVRDEPEDSPGG